MLGRGNMAVRLGFVLLTHNKPSQAARLVSRLNSMFGRPPIAWHHDFTFCTLPADAVTNNIFLVRPHFRTGWASFAVVDAMLSALEMLFRSRSQPDWFVLLSGADYPTKSADKILHDLSTSPYDVHMHHERICYNHYEREWQALCYDRYCAVKFLMPLIRIDGRPRLIERTITIGNPLFTAPFTPFSKTLLCFAGEHWFCANRSAAEYLIEFHKTKPALADHYRKRDAYVIVPEELYYHTILCNSHFRISQNHWRYVDWSQGGAHPKTLLMEDLTRLRESTAHFARKFDTDIDEEILNSLDDLVMS